MLQTLQQAEELKHAKENQLQKYNEHDPRIIQEKSQS
jgi:hypothetical protein